MSSDLEPVLIAGPTAGGKSALALALAERLGGMIVNADSMQVYRELSILTARPTTTDLARAPHALYGFVPASEAYSAGRFVVDAKAALEDARRSGLRPILVGGTGLYFKALLEGLSPIPEVDEDIRRHWRAEAGRKGPEALHAHLANTDPEMASRLGPSDTQRIVRALEVLESSGNSLADWQRMPGVPLIEAAHAKCLVLNPDRAVLHQRVDARLDRMVEEGAVAEAKRLGDLQLDESLPAMRAIGVAAMIKASHGTATIAEALGEAKAETRQYVKRQQTWLRRNMITWNNINSQENEKYIDIIVTFIQS
jgi:tRNA dimethylallyltransferase